MESLALSALFGGAYEGRRVLVTGHTGFKGSWLCLWLTSLGAQVTGLALDPDTQPSHWTSLDLQGVTDLRVDLRDSRTLENAIKHARPEIVFHLAAQPLVRRSYREPTLTFHTNALGLVNLFESIRATPSVAAVINATTDKVYLEHDTVGGYTENDPLGGHDPYSASKACAELISDCYRKSFFAESGQRIATARAGNVIGGGDWSEDRLIPDLVRAAYRGEALELRNPNATRPWQHVLEPLSGYLSLGQRLLSKEPFEGAWNFGPPSDATLPVHAVVAQMQKFWPNLKILPAPGKHPHEAKTLELDCSKAAHDLAWQPIWNIAETLARTARWYRDHHEHGHISSQMDLNDYVASAKREAAAWTA